MKWTTEKPTEPGWYWFVNNWMGPTILRTDGKATLRVGETIWVPLADHHGQWAGPIREPEEE